MEYNIDIKVESFLVKLILERRKEGRFSYKILSEVQKKVCLHYLEATNSTNLHEINTRGFQKANG